jgi:hypothetical protein
VANFTTQIHVTGSARNLDEDLPFLQTIVDTIYANHAIVFRDWIGPASKRQAQDLPDSEVDWETILNDNLESIKKSELVIVEATQARFGQGFQAYIAAQHKKPTLVVTRKKLGDTFMSGVKSKLISVKEYRTEDELRTIVTKFIKQNNVAEKDLRFNMILDRRIYKYLRDTSYETGKNKSQIVRELLERDIERRK